MAVCNTPEWQLKNARLGTQHLRLGKLEHLDTVVLGGGGMKGLVYIGIHLGLMENGIHIGKLATNFVGCSIGAFAAMMFCIGTPPDRMLQAVQSMRGIKLNPLNLMSIGGMDDMRGIRATIRSLLGSNTMTMKQFTETTGKSLTTVCTDIVSERIVHINASTHPDMLVEDAVMDSMRIPMLFPSHDFDDGTTVLYDGGVVQGYPVAAASNPNTTLGFHFKSFKEEEGTKEHFAPTNLITKLASAFTMTAAVAEGVAYDAHYARMRRCTVLMNVPFLSWMDMDVKQKDIDTAMETGKALGRCLAVQYAKAQDSPSSAGVSDARRTAFVLLNDLSPRMNKDRNQLTLTLRPAELLRKEHVRLLSVAVATNAAAQCKHGCTDGFGSLTVHPLSISTERRGDHHLKLHEVTLMEHEEVQLLLQWDTSRGVLCERALNNTNVTFDWCAEM